MNEEKLKEMAKPNKVGRAREFLQQGRKDEVYGDNEYYRKGFLDGGLYADKHPKNPWISVKDKLPDKAWDNRMGRLTEDSDIVIAVSSTGKLFSNLYYSYHLHEWLEKGAGLNGIDRVLQYYKITHWMPTPETPEGGEK